ncbi:putative caspase-like protein [Azospirillum agricola]|uniref:caspase family protein n=1 Tax=Azospirillum agricola TaxID=1720247 RepID=UPI001AE6F6A6|nr:caspase family protein [Azospirillum agricola]MBP2231676.1 putative caspase-like protein [Azospirillum agricola]
MLRFPTFLAAAVAGLGAPAAMAGLTLAEPNIVVGPEKPDMAIIAATLPGGRAFDQVPGQKTGNGPLAPALAAAFTARNCTVATLFDRVSDTVRKATQEQQVPWLAASGATDMPCAAGGNGRSVAMVVANAAYKGQGVFPLVNSVADGRLVGSALKAAGYDVVEVYDADRPVLESSFRAFTERARGAVSAVFYYSGYGVGIGGAGPLPSLSLLAVDQNAGVIENSLSVNTLLRGFAESAPARTIVILDTDFSTIPAVSR